MALGTTGINTPLVANTIGVGSNDVGTLCTSFKINKWSKRKPVSYQTSGSLTDAQFKSIKWGFTIPQFSSLDSLASTVWTYNPPTGGATSPYRLGDFRNYKHDSIIPFNIVKPSATNISTKVSMSAKLMLDSSVAAENITLADLFNLDALYFGVAIKNSSNQIYAKTMGTVVSADSNNISFDGCSIYKNIADTFTVYTFLTATPITEWSTLAEQTLYSLNAISGYGVSTFNTVVPAVDTFHVGLAGLATADRNAFNVVTPYTYSGGVVSGVLNQTRTLTKDYALDSVELVITRKSPNNSSRNNVVVFSGVHTHTSSVDECSPDYIYREDAYSNVTVKCNVGAIFTITGVETLADPTEYYDYGFSFVMV